MDTNLPNNNVKNAGIKRPPVLFDARNLCYSGARGTHDRNTPISSLKRAGRLIFANATRSCLFQRRVVQTHDSSNQPAAGDTDLRSCEIIWLRNPSPRCAECVCLNCFRRHFREIGTRLRVPSENLEIMILTRALTTISTLWTRFLSTVFTCIYIKINASKLMYNDKI